jgi:chromosome segregation ATPase
MTYTADVSMFPYFKNEENEKLKKQLVEKTDEYNIIVFYNTENKKQVIKLEEECDELIEKLTAKQEELNEESQQRLKNKECWMSVQKQYHKLKEENKELKDKNEKLKIENEILQEKLKLKDIELNEQSDEICAIIESKKELRKQKEILHMENVSLKEFRKKAEDECEASAITELFMNQIEELNNQVESLKEKEEELKNLHNYVESKQDLVFEFICGEQDNTFEDQIDYLKKTIWGKLPRGIVNDLIVFGMVDNPSKSNYDFCSEEYFREQVCDIYNIEYWRKWLEGDEIDFMDEDNDDEQFFGTFEELEQNEQLLDNFMNDGNNKDEYTQWYCEYKNIDFIYAETTYGEYVVFVKEN